MLCAGQMPVERTLSQEALWGLCVDGEKEVKPVGLTVFRNGTKRVADFRVLHVCTIRRFILLITQKANEADEMRQHTGFL